MPFCSRVRAQRRLLTVAMLMFQKVMFLTRFRWLPETGSPSKNVLGVFTAPPDAAHGTAAVRVPESPPNGHSGSNVNSLFDVGI
jgi:hypothetical protein